MRRLALATAGVVVIGIVAPATASALTRKQADAIAVRTLRPLAGKKNAILFGLPRPVPAGSRVFPADPSRGRQGKTVRKKAARLRRAAWLYWLDQVPYAMFSHTSTYALVDDATGRVVARKRIGWYPTVNGKRPAFVTPNGYKAKRYRVYAKLARRRGTAAAVGPVVQFAWPLATIPPGALKGECVLIVSDWSDPLFQNNYDAFSDWSRKMKIPTFFSTADGPVTTIPGPGAKPPTKNTLRDNATELIVKHDCTDIVLYITGHGMEAKDGPPTVVTRSEIEVTDFGFEQKTTGVTADDVYYAISLHPSTGFKVKIDSCFSGRFLDDFAPRGADGKRESKLKNLLIMEVSSSAKDVSLGPSEEWDKDNPNSLGQFTNQNLTGLEQFFGSQEEIGKAVAEGGSLIARALDRAFDLGASVNKAIDEEGNVIKPLEFTNFGPPAPKLNPIRAVFTPATFTTVYTMNATGEGLKYAWSVKFDADTECVKTFKGNSPQPNQATWDHTDKEQGGTCGHLPSQIGNRGHNATITVVVSNDDWTCTATYFGTQGDNGQTTGNGDTPLCRRR
jgi:hypothetical protein